MIRIECKHKKTSPEHHGVELWMVYVEKSLAGTFLSKHEAVRFIDSAIVVIKTVYADIQIEVTESIGGDYE